MAKKTIEYPVEFYDLQTPSRASMTLCAIPFYAYKVFAPTPINRELNMFQKAILGIMKIASYTADDIAAKLKLDRDLVVLIQAELAAKQLISGDGTVTSKGTKALHQESWDTVLELEDFTIGYIYQDPSSKGLLPRFNTHRKFADIKYAEDDNQPRIELGTKGAPKNENLFIFDCATFDNPPKSPSNKDIFELIRKHTMAAEYPDSDLVSLNNKTKPPKGLQKISLLDHEPQRALLVTYIFAPAVSSAREDWRVLDPFGFGESNGMKAIVKEYCLKDEELSKRIDKLVGKQRENWQAKHKENHQAILHSALQGIHEKLGLHNLSEDMERHLLEFEFQYQDFRILNEKNAMPVAAQKVLEAMMLEIADQDRDIFRKVSKRIPATKSREDLKVVLEAAASRAGAAGIPDIYAKSKPQQILAWPWNPVSLRPMVAATLIAANDKPDHTFTKMIRAEPQLLFFVADASMLRDAGAHAGSNQARETDHYEQMHLELDQIISAFINSTKK